MLIREINGVGGGGVKESINQKQEVDKVARL